jgi:hypothetical protein
MANAFKSKIISFSHLYFISLQIPANLVGNYMIFNVNCHFKVSPSAGLVCAADVLCRNIGVVDRDRISLFDISHSFNLLITSCNFSFVQTPYVLFYTFGHFSRFIYGSYRTFLLCRLLRSYFIHLDAVLILCIVLIIF